MTWDKTWEDIYRTRGYNRYPSEEVIGFVLRNFRDVPNRKQVKILEIGCGQGANLWFIAREGYETYGIDASETSIEMSRKVMTEEKLTADLKIGDVSDLSSYYDGLKFDAIIDMGCLQHNPLKSSKRILGQAYSLLKPGGKMFSRMMQAGTYGDGMGTPAGLKAYKDINEGPLMGWGFIQLCEIDDLNYLFSDFKDVNIEESIRSVNSRKNYAKRWVIVATKVD